MACRTFALRLEYDGSGFGGSQYQTNARTVQDELERALLPLVGAPQRVALAGRTDAGVHASGQVAAALLPERWTAETLQRALNARLPADLAVTVAVEVPAGFDPRRQALWRRYEYRIWNAAVRSPLRRGQSWYVRYSLDVQAMCEAVASLEGVHDFASFAGALEPPGRSTVRAMRRATLRREGTLITIEFEANAFLPHQIRRTVGALVEVGRGNVAARQFARWLDEPVFGAAGPAAPPHGLSLVRVAYEKLRFEAGEDG